MSTPDRHQQTVFDQFTRQAALYAAGSAINNEDALRLLVECSGAGPNDTVLDVACGAGQVVCAFARLVRHATGIDLVPAMIEKARGLQAERQLSNTSWQIGDVTALPFANESFRLVTSRYAFHHLLQPQAVLSEMKRVCAPHGNVVVADVIASANPAQAGAFNRMERLRDPSHVRAMPLSELEQLVQAVGLRVARTAFYRLELDVETVLQGSFPMPGDADEVRRLFTESLATDAMGVGARRQGDTIQFAYPIAILVTETADGRSALPT
jgi:ubiquinone/menaquinone biosynthesis C-methylase UbiE